MMGSAFGATDFEYSKTQEVREKYMETDEILTEEGERITNHLGQVGWSCVLKMRYDTSYFFPKDSIKDLHAIFK